MATDNDTPSRPPRALDTYAPIGAFMDRELVMTPVDDGFELRHRDLLLGWLGDGSLTSTVNCVTSDGSWRFKEGRGQRIDVSPRGHDEPVLARYRSALLSRGSFELPDDDPRLRMRAAGLGNTWKVRRGRRDPVLQIKAKTGPWQIRFMPAARDLHHLPLLTMLSFHAMRVETLAGGGGGAEGPVT